MDSKESVMLTDFPKISCPFVRVNFKVDHDDWREYGRRLQLREPNAYLVVDTVNPGYEWVFDDPDTVAVEKLDGANVKILTKDGRLITVQSRKNVIDPLQIQKGKAFLAEGVLISSGKGKVLPDGEQAGELIGPKLQGNPYHLLVHEWFPFSGSLKGLTYRSFHKHDRTFDNWSSWFEEFLFSRFYQRKRARLPSAPERVLAEGVVFHNERRRAEGKVHMAKLRRDMFLWYYEPDVKIHGYDKDMEVGDAQ